MVVYTGQGQVRSNILIEPGTTGVIGGAGEDGVREYVGTRGGGYGLDADLARKQAANYDHGAEAQARGWIEALTGEKIVGSFAEGLKNGVALCKAVNAIKPGTIKKVNDSAMPFKQMENVSAFLKACRVLGVPEHSLFETVDLYEAKDISLVVTCIFALGGAVQTSTPEFAGPKLGVPARRGSGSGSGSRATVSRPGPHCGSGSGSSAKEEKEQQVEQKAEEQESEEKAEEKVEVEVAEEVEDQVQSQEEEQEQPDEKNQAEEKELEPTEEEPQVQVQIASPPRAEALATAGVYEGQGKVASNIYIPAGTTGVIGGADEEGNRQYVGARGGGYGMDADLAKLQAANYDHGAEAQARAWIEEVTHKKWGGSFSAGLKDGVLLCELVNTIKPGSVKKVNSSTMPFKQMENVSAFLKACRALGVAEHSLFETVDLFEEKDIGLVVKCLFALGGAVQKSCPSYSGPSLGVKASEGASRNWTPEQRRQMARANVGMTKLMEGSSNVMDRVEVLRTGITAGAEYTGPSVAANTVPQLGMGSKGIMERPAIVRTGVTMGAEYSGTGDSSVVPQLSMGSKDIQERPEISKANNICFGAEASSSAGTGA
jgi:hypothetical protein